MAPDPLSADEVSARLERVPAWSFDADPPRLRRAFKLRDFRKALAWVNRVGMLAEQANHHPDFHLTGWNRVELVLWTHTAGGVTEGDIALAREIDALARADGLE